MDSSPNKLLCLIFLCRPQFLTTNCVQRNGLNMPCTNFKRFFKKIVPKFHRHASVGLQLLEALRTDIKTDRTGGGCNVSCASHVTCHLSPITFYYRQQQQPQTLPLLNPPLCTVGWLTKAAKPEGKNAKRTKSLQWQYKIMDRGMSILAIHSSTTDHRPPGIRVSKRK